MAEVENHRNIKLTVEYDGSNYAGWQWQENGVSIQEKLEAALSRQVGHPVRLSAAGRTDAGVHALGQVANFFTTSSLSTRAIWKGTLAFLPKDIAITAAEEVSVDFDSRRSARMRWYRYFICNRSVQPAVGRQFLTYVPFVLNFERMRQAACVLSGDHDFSAFRSIACQAARTRLTLKPIEITIMSENIIRIDYRCQSFLHNMVRIITGTLVSCGRGKLEKEDIEAMLSTGIRRNEAVTLSPNGLFLYRVLYEGDADLLSFT